MTVVFCTSGQRIHDLLGVLTTSCWDQDEQFPSDVISGVYVGVSNNRGTSKWMVCNGKPYKNGWLGGTTIFGNIHVSFQDFGVITTYPTRIYIWL